MLRQAKNIISQIRKYKVPIAEVTVAAILIGDIIYSSVFGGRTIPDALSYLEVGGASLLAYGATNKAL